MFLPNGTAIGIKQAILRSSVDLGFSILIVTATFIAISNADPEKHLATDWMDLLMLCMPTWLIVENLLKTTPYKLYLVSA